MSEAPKETARTIFVRIREWGALVSLVLREAAGAYSANGNFGSAAMMAYYGFLSLMPLLLLVVFSLGMIMESSESVMNGVRGLMEQLFPAFSESILGDLLNLVRRKVWGIVTVVILLWSMTPFAGAIRSALYRIFKSDRHMHFIKAKLLDLSAVMALLVLFVCMAAGKVLSSSPVLRSVLVPGILRNLFTFLATLGVLAFLYLVFSPVRLGLVHLLAGAGSTACLLAVIRPVFGLVLQFNPDYGYAFGSLKAIFLLIIWVYYTFAGVLFGAEVMAAVRRRESLLLRGLFMPGPAKPRISGVLLDRFVRHFGEGERLFNEGEPGLEMFYVLEGAVDLSKAGKKLKTVLAGDYFGEMSMLIQAPRSATAQIAAQDTRLVAISQDNFETILRENPAVVRSILKEMAQRLQSTNERLGETDRGQRNSNG